MEIISQRVAEIFKNTVEFLGKVIFHNDVAFLGRPTFNKDTAGFATILTGGSEVEVTFEREYTTEPIVTATAQITGGAAVGDIPSYAIADVNTKGFKIRLSRTTGMDIRFAWVALAVSNSDSFQGNGGVVITPVLTPTPTAEPVTVTPTSTEILSPTPTPTIEVTPTPTPTEVVTPTSTPTIEMTPTIESTPTSIPAEVIFL